LFENPTRDERILYINYWQNKLKSNKDIEFSDELKVEIADTTQGFSFAYLKEAFVSSLVLLAGYDKDKKPQFGSVIKRQIHNLRAQLDHEGGSLASKSLNSGFSGVSISRRAKESTPSLQGSSSSNSRIYRTETSDTKESKDVTSVAKAAVALGRSFIY